MSSFGGSTTVNGAATDPGLQEAPRGEDGPEFSVLKKAFDDCIAGLQPYCDQTRINLETRYALWPNQSSDGKKHARAGNGQPEPVPWDGASDLRVFLTDEAINCKVALQCTAFRKANIVAVPIEGNDIKRAKVVSNFMRWLVQTQIQEIDREVELLSQYVNEKGVAATGQFWEVTQEKTLTTVTAAQIQQQFPQLNMQELLTAPEAADSICAIFEEIYGCSKGKAKKMLRELQAKGTTTVPTLGREISRPVVRAFNLDQDLFIPSYATDIEHAPAIYRVQYFTAEQLRGFARTDGWDEAWVEAAIDRCRGRLLTIQDVNDYNQSISRSFVYQEQRFNDLIGVVYAYQRLSDEDGVPGIYLTIFNPDLPPDGGATGHEGYAKYGLLGYAHGKYPFVLHRREFLSRKLHDSRGIPEVGKPTQDMIKVHRDSRIDAASYAILPPMMYPVGRPPGRWGAGARIPERRQGEYHFADKPSYDPTTEKSEDLLSTSWNRYNGFVSRDTDPTFANLINQCQTDKFMAGWAKAFQQIYALYLQFGSEQVYFRVVGLRQSDPVEFNKGDQNESFDFYLSWDSQSMDMERQQQKLEGLAKICATFDKYGQVDYSEVLQIAVENIDPNWAERVIQPKDVGGQKVVDETHTMLAQVYSGVDRDIDLNAPPEVVQQTIQNYGQSPDVQQRYNTDEAFRTRMDKIMKQTQFQITQKQNAQIGRYGA